MLISVFFVNATKKADIRWWRVSAFMFALRFVQEPVTSPPLRRPIIRISSNKLVKRPEVRLRAVEAKPRFPAIWACDGGCRAIDRIASRVRSWCKLEFVFGWGQ